MVGFIKLGYKDDPVKKLLERHSKSQSVVKDNQINYGNPIYYSIKENPNTLVLYTPIAAINWESILDHFNKVLENKLSDYHVVMGLTGQSIGEQHIVTAYFPAGNGKAMIFDSKSVDAEAFFANDNRTSNVFSRAWRALTANNPADFKNNQRDFQYHALGTQSTLDGVTCGAHCAQNILNIIELLQSQQEITPKNVLEKVKNPVQQAIEGLSIQVTWFDFIKQAWQDTFMPEQDDAARKDMHFGHYFMGWPQKVDKSHVLLYILSLSVLFTPLLNSLKLVLEFPIHAMAESVSYLKNKLLTWSPTQSGLQYLRSGLLLLAYGTQVLFKGTALMFRAILSPVASAKAAWNVHPVLGVLSALFSISTFVVLAVFAAPAAMGLLANLAPAASVVLSPVIQTLGYPFVQLFSLMGASITWTSGASFTAMLATALGIAGKDVAEHKINQANEKVDLPKLDKTFENRKVSHVGTTGSGVLQRPPVSASSTKRFFAEKATKRKSLDESDFEKDISTNP